MSHVDAAEKEASEVLHSLLSVERIEKQEIIIEAVDNSPSHSYHSNPGTNSDHTDADTSIQWHTPVAISTHSLFSAIDTNNQFPQSMDDQQVVVFILLILT